MTKNISSNLSPQSDAIPPKGFCPTRALTTLTVVGAVLLGLIVTSCTKDPVGPVPASSTSSTMSAPQASTLQAKVSIYKCPMHPEITSDKPGKCSVCGMTLVKAP